MNARIPNLRIVSPHSRTATVDPYGFDMHCEFEYDEGEAPILWPEPGHPGSPPNACLLSCVVGGVEIYDMLNSSQIERIEELVLEKVGG